MINKQFPDLDFTEEIPDRAKKPMKKKSPLEIILFTNQGMKLIWLGVPWVMLITDIIATIAIRLIFKTWVFAIFLALGILIYIKIIRSYHQLAAGKNTTFYNLFLYEPEQGELK